VPLLDEGLSDPFHESIRRRGRKWKSVFVLNIVDGCMPSDLGAGTKRRARGRAALLYVAMTRAKDDLHLIVPAALLCFTVKSPRATATCMPSRTRFIPEKAAAMFERTTWPVVSAASPSPAGRKAQIDVRARMRGMWR